MKQWMIEKKTLGEVLWNNFTWPVAQIASDLSEILQLLPQDR